MHQPKSNSSTALQIHKNRIDMLRGLSIWSLTAEWQKGTSSYNLTHNECPFSISPVEGTVGSPRSPWQMHRPLLEGAGTGRDAPCTAGTP